MVEFKMAHLRGLTLMRIQEIFNYSECKTQLNFIFIGFECRCAYCEMKCHLVLNTSFIIGDKSKMDQFDIDRLND